MNAEFTPNKNTIQHVETFRHWCQKVLPLVYDDSLSYYELLCKVTNYLNETIKNCNLLGEDVSNLYTAYEQLQGYVNDYFTNLDVQEEINIKLDNMAKGGYLDEAIGTSFMGILNTLNVLTSRVNQLSTLGEGSTTGDAELLDARVDYKGRTWDNLGEHLRSVMVEQVGYRRYVNVATDMDTMVDNGVYNIVNDIVSECNNYPSKVGGLLLVLRRVEEEYPIGHILLSNDNRLYTRYKTGKGWSDWVCLAVERKIVRHCDGVGALVDVAETYFNVAYNPNDKLIYDTQHGLYTDTTVVVGEGDNKEIVKAIVCSQFEQACIGGITYGNSRYVRSENDALAWGFVSDGTGHYPFAEEYDTAFEYMTACEQAKYFENHGVLNTFDVNRNGLKAGDLVFFTTDTANEEIYYRKITHVGICLGADKDRFSMMHSTPKYLRLVDRYVDEETGETKGTEAGVMVATYLYTTKAPAYFVHSPIVAEYESDMLVEKLMNKQGTYEIGKSGYLGEFGFDEAIGRGFYTIKIEDFSDSVGYINVDYDGLGSSVKYSCVKNGHVNSVVFYAEMPISKITVRTANSTSFDCKSIKLYKGYCP